MAVRSAIVALSAYDVPDSEVTAFTVGSATVRFRIDQASVTNYTSTDAVLTVYLSQSSAAVTDIVKAIDALVIPAGDTIVLMELIGRSLNTGGVINAFASSASALALSATGTEIT